MKSFLFLTHLAIFAFAFLIACGNSGTVPASSGSNAKQLAIGEPWKFYVLDIRYSSTYPGCTNYCNEHDGWRWASIDLAVENNTEKPASFPSFLATEVNSQKGNAELVDTGGYQRFGSSNGPGFVLVWPNFRLRLTFISEIPLNQEPSKLTLQVDGRSYEIDLSKKDPQIKTPFEQIPVTWQPKQVGESFGIDRDIQVTVKSAKIVDGAELSRYFSGAKGKAAATLTFDVRNTGGYDFQLVNAVSRPYAFDNIGRVNQGELYSSSRSTYSTVAPNQTLESQAFALFENSIESIQTDWFVMCVQSNPANKSVSKSGKCDIFQVNK